MENVEWVKNKKKKRERMRRWKLQKGESQWKIKKWRKPKNRPISKEKKNKIETIVK